LDASVRASGHPICFQDIFHLIPLIFRIFYFFSGIFLFMQIFVCIHNTYLRNFPFFI